MRDEESRAGYFLNLLDPQQRANLVQVRKGLEIPLPQPTQQELEEAQNAQCSEGI